MKLRLVKFNPNLNSLPTQSAERQKASPIKDSSKFQPIDVNDFALRLKRKWVDLIIEGDGIEEYKDDKSSALFAACLAMAREGFSEDEISTVLTDRSNFLGTVAYEHSNSDRRDKAVKWLKKYTLRKAIDEVGNDSPTHKSSGKFSLTFEKFSDIGFDPSTVDLLEGVLLPETVVVLFGPSNSGKTFAALDISLHIAQGKAWHERKVQKGLVVYLAAEGGFGINKRIVAYRKQNSLERVHIPFYLAKGSADMLDKKEFVGPLIKAIKDIEMNEEKLQLIVIDTLSRTFSGDENDSKAMRNYVNSLDLIRKETKACVMVVHHTGKDPSRGARGHSNLKGDADTLIEIKSIDGSVKSLSLGKQRDDSCEQAFGFSLQSVDIGTDDSGKVISSCVVIPQNLEALKAFGPKPIGEKAKDALMVLREVTKEGKANEEEWKKTFKERFYTNRKPSSASSAFSRAKGELERHQEIELKDGFVFLKSQINSNA